MSTSQEMWAVYVDVPETRKAAQPAQTESRTLAEAMERRGIKWYGNTALVPGYPNLIYTRDADGNVTYEPIDEQEHRVQIFESELRAKKFGTEKEIRNAVEYFRSTLPGNEWREEAERRLDQFRRAHCEEAGRMIAAHA